MAAAGALVGTTDLTTACAHSLPLWSQWAGAYVLSLLGRHDQQHAAASLGALSEMLAELLQLVAHKACLQVREGKLKAMPCGEAMLQPNRQCLQMLQDVQWSCSTGSRSLTHRAQRLRKVGVAGEGVACFNGNLEVGGCERDLLEGSIGSRNQVVCALQPAQTLAQHAS